MRVLRSWLIVGIVLAAALGIFYVAARRAPSIEVRAVPVSRGKVERSVASTKAGAIRSRRASDLSVEIAGTITAIPVREGQKVSEGDLLITIDHREANAWLAGAQAELKVLQALAAEARARRREAAKSLERVKELQARAVASDAELDAARLLEDSTSAALSAAECRVEVQNVAVLRAKIAVDKCELRAPFAGVVSELFVELGEWATPGKRGLRLVDPDRLYVTAELDEVDIGPVREGLPARVTLDPYRDRRLAGRVSRVSSFVSELQEQNRTLEVEVELTGNLEGLDLKPGTSADVELILEERADVLRIPASAILQDDRVLLVGPDGRARGVSVRVGLRNWEFAEILDGLRDGDLLIVSLESDRLRDGAPVRVVAETGR